MAVDFMVPFVSGANTSWPFQNITETSWTIYTEEYRRAANVAGWYDASRASYAATVGALRERADDSLALFWPLDGAAAQPDAAA
jgi:hypothetical protein